MTIEELKAQLETSKVPVETIEAVMNAVLEERNKGIDAHRKANKEAQSMRKYKQALETLGLDEDTDLDNFTAELLKSKSKGSGDDDGRVTTKVLKEQLDSLKKALADKDTQIKTKTIASELSKAFGDKVYGADLLIKDLISTGQVDLDNEKVVFKFDGEFVDLTNGVNKVLELRPDIKKNPQVAGTKTSGTQTMPSNIDAIIKSGDQKAISANLADIAKSIGLKL